MSHVEMRRSASGIGYHRAGTGPPLVLLHGIPGSAQTWLPVADRLFTSFDVIVADLLGFGGSSRPKPGIAGLHAAAQAVAVDALLRELQLGPAMVVGHDFGGPTALLLHALRPSALSGIGLLATNAFTDTPIPFPLSMVTWPVFGTPARRALFSAVSLRMMLRQGRGPGSPVLDPREHLGDRDQRRAIATIFAGSLTNLAALYGPVEDELSRLSVPVFVGWGDSDPFFPLAQGERTAAAVGAELRVYRGAGHFLPQERPADVAADIAALATASVP